ncbi:hypothetical protein Ancab_036712 [Ancistrocladus abbreviatus]
MLRMGKSHADTGVKQHRLSYADAVKGMASRTWMTHKLTDMQNNEKMAPRTGMKHNVVDTQNNEKPLLVFTSKEEDGGELLEVGCHEASSSSGHVELGVGLINDSINVTDKSLLPKLDVPVSSSLPTEPSETGWLQKLGLRPLPEPQSLGLKHRQPEPVDLRRETTQEGPLRPLAKERSITPGPQGLNGPLHSPSNPDASN